MPKDDVLLVIDSQNSTRSNVGNFVLSSGSGGGGGVSPSELANYLRRDGTAAMMGNLDMGGFNITNVTTVDSVPILIHVNNPDAHHNRIHDYNSTDHTGLLLWDNLDFGTSELTDIRTRPHNSLQNIGPNDHHNQVHAITGGDHTAVGALALDVIGIPSTNGVLGYITPSSNPGAAIKLLRTDAAGLLVLKRLEGTDYLKSTGGYLQAATYVSAGSYVSAVTYVDTPIVQQAGNVSIIAGINIALKPTGYVYLDTDRAIRTNSFVSGFAGGGWQIDQNISAPGTNAEFDNLTIRGRMRVYELIIQQIRATNGSIFVSSVSKAKTVTLVSGDTYTITTDDYHGFLVNDLIRAQRFTKGNITTSPSEGMTGQVYRCDMRVTAVTDLYTYTAVRENGSDIPKTNYEFVRIGNTSDATRRGSLYLSSDDSNAPFIDVVNGVDSWTAWAQTAKTKVRIGKITGVTSVANEYGLIAGNTGFGDSDSWIKVSNIGVQMNKIPLKFFNGANWTGYWSADGASFWIGPNVTDKRIEWNGTTLNIVGAITVTAGGNAATTTDVSTAQTNAQTYTNNYAPNKALSNTSVNWAKGDTLGGNAYDTARVNNVAASTVQSGAARANAGLDGSGRVAINIRAVSLPDDVAVAGLNLTKNYLGYYNGSSWVNFIKSDGTFRFGSSLTGNRIEWNGTQLAGYNSLGTLQWYASSADGLIYAGGGYVKIGSSGISAGDYTFLNSNGVNISAEVWLGWQIDRTPVMNRVYSFTNDFGSFAAVFGSFYSTAMFGNPRTGTAYMQAFTYTSSNVFSSKVTFRIDSYTNKAYFNDFTMWHEGNDGPGSGLNADLLDNLDSTAFAKLSASQTFFGNQTISGVLEVTNYILVDSTIDFTRQSVTPSPSALTVKMYQGGDGNMYFRGPNGYARITGLTVLSGSFP